MKRSEIEVGGYYLAKVQGKATRVRVEAIRRIFMASIHMGHDVFDVIDLTTKEHTTFHTLQRFRGHARGPAKRAAGPRCPTGDEVDPLRPSDYVYAEIE